MKHCRRVDVDQVPVLVHMDGEPTDETIAALRHLVRAARRRYIAEHPDADRGSLAAIGGHGRTLESVWCCEGAGYGPDGSCQCQCHAPRLTVLPPAVHQAQ